MTAATILVWVAGAYLAAGAVTAVVALVRGLGRIDPDAREATRGFRLIVFPGLVLLWPVVVRRLRSGEERPPSEQTAHKRMWRTP
ncbi:MAG: hypothetical protein HKN17_01320 [Rhodothermales bacterium]|nr:hypothetical protein [Rhodothermales bacterium]